MARLRDDKSDIRKLTRSGRGKSLGLTLPVSIVRKLKWKEKQKVVVSLKGRTILIKDWRK